MTVSSDGAETTQHLFCGKYKFDYTFEWAHIKIKA